MTVQDAILASIETVLGLDKNEMLDNLELDLFENGLLDSLTLVTVIGQIELLLSKKINIKDMKPEDFSTVNHLTSAISGM